MCGRINFLQFSNQKPKQETLAQIKISRIKMQIINIILFQRPMVNMVFKGPICVICFHGQISYCRYEAMENHHKITILILVKYGTVYALSAHFLFLFMNER